MLDVIARLDLNNDQRGALDAIRDDLKTREAELIEKITVAAKRLRELQQQHMEADQTLKDLNGHLATANMDAANRAEELLTAEQRRQLVRGGAHVMTPTQQTR
jgi:F0F1-type ATP synthase membrane subunit b/b'